MFTFNRISHGLDNIFILQNCFPSKDTYTGVPNCAKMSLVVGLCTWWDKIVSKRRSVGLKAEFISLLLGISLRMCLYKVCFVVCLLLSTKHVWILEMHMCGYLYLIFCSIFKSKLTFIACAAWLAFGNCWDPSARSKSLF